MYEAGKITRNQWSIPLSLLKKIFSLACGFIQPRVEEITKLSRL